MYNLQSILNLHQSGKIKEAEEGYKKILEISPGDVNANYLLGKLLNDTGRPDKAEILLKRAYRHLSSNVAVAFEFAKTLMALNRANESIRILDNIKHTGIEQAKLFLEALSVDRDDNELLRGFETIQNSENRRSLMLKMADIYERKGFLEKSKYYYFEVLNIAPENVIALHNLSSILRRLGDPKRALEFMRKAQSQGLNTFQMFHNFGNIYSDLNLLDEAIFAYQKAINLNPFYEDSYYNLTAIYAELGRFEKSVELFKKAILNGNTNEGIIVALLDQYIRFGAVDLAQNLIDEWHDKFITSSRFQVSRAKLYALKGCVKEAFDLLIEIDTHSAKLLQAEYALMMSNHHFVMDNMGSYTSVPETAVMAKAYLTTAQRLAHGTSSLDYARFVRAYDIEEFLDKSQSTNFLPDLMLFLRKQHTGTNAPLNQTLNKGTQTRGDILAFTDNPEINQLKQFFSHALNSYITELSNSGESLGEVALPSREFNFIGSWSVLLSKEGYHTNHVHPEGLLSAVFYVDVPNELNVETKEGFLSFGVPNFPLEKKLTPEYTVQPLGGRLVIFPSFFWHGTLPFHSDDTRLTIAFDVADTQSK